MTVESQREEARKFANKWMKGGDEKQDCHSFWIELLQNVLGVENVTEYINFEKPVKLQEKDGKVHTRYIDGYIHDVKALIEQKGSNHPLDVPEHQSGGEMLTPFEQARRYNDNIAHSENARWIITSNFKEIWIYDMDKPIDPPVKILVEDLQDKYKSLSILIKQNVTQVSNEIKVSKQAGDIIGLIYNAFLKQYGISEFAPQDETPEQQTKREHKLNSLNALCVRLVFCLYAEDAGIFGNTNMFHNYLQPFPVNMCRQALINLFRVLDQPENERGDYLEDNLAVFPYVNGGLFKDDIEIPQFTEEIKTLLLKNASEDFNWHDISPTIFGAVFESTLNPETRRLGGMHYTSIENIHKVIDPLFMNSLYEELAKIEEIKVKKTKIEQLDAFRNKLSSLTFLDPACGSGNFLTETYLSLRRMENHIIQEEVNLGKGQIEGQMSLGGTIYPVQVSIQQFYGIEINDFAVTVAKTALWIAESQMLEETKAIELLDTQFLPLKTYVNITEGNALLIDWNEVISSKKLSYIIGNPPFAGRRYRTPEQIADVSRFFTYKDIDYVACWYIKAARYIQCTGIQAAFVSTNSICQGEQVSALWKEMSVTYGTHINFAYRTFIWDSEASKKAHVHCVIIGFSLVDLPNKFIYEGNKKNRAAHINGYLFDAPDVFISGRSDPLCNVPHMKNGNVPLDGGALKVEPDDLNKFKSMKYIKKLVGGIELLKNKQRYVIWLVGVSPSEIKSDSYIAERVELCRKNRLEMKDAETRKFADTPTTFRDINNPDNYIALPMVSGERRRYIPMAFFHGDTIPTNQVQIIPNATLYEFGVLESNVHMSWMRAIAGRLKSDYRYSKDIVYNNFPWPSATEDQKEKIRKTAQGILDARALYQDSNLSDLYDPNLMPAELKKAHTANNLAVMHAYGFKNLSESDCVTALLKMYQQLVDNNRKDT